MSAAYQKKSAQEIDRSLLKEPAMTPEDWRSFEEGIRLFNAREFWKAHEAWEAVWKRHPEESRIFFQGIIQLAAAYHLLIAKRRYGGAMRNFEKAEEKLQLFPSEFLCIHVDRLLHAIESARGEVQRIGEPHLDRFDVSLVPIIICSEGGHNPPYPGRVPSDDQG